MNSNSQYIESIKEDDEINPRFYKLSNPVNDNIEDLQGVFDNIKEASGNINFRAIANINQDEQNETQNTIHNEINEIRSETRNEIHNEKNEIQNEQNELILNSNHEEIEDKNEEYKEANQIPQEVIKNKIENLVLLEDMLILEKNLVIKKLDDSLKTKIEDKLGYLFNNSKEINFLTCKYREKKMAKKEGSPMKFLRKKRNPK